MTNKIVMKKLSEVKPYVRNPRRNDNTVELLCKSIPKVGFNVPLVIDKNGVIVKGHARFTAAIRLGMHEVPCIITDADEEAIKADRILDNKIHEYSEYDNEEIRKEVDDINFDFDFSDLGFKTVEDEPDEPKEQGKVPAMQDAVKERAEASNVEVHEMPKIESANIPKKYYKVVCEKCGKVMFIPQDKVEG